MSEEIPLCRELEYGELVNAIETGIHIIVLTGSMSSGKTTVIEAIKKNENLNKKFSHVYCETGMEVKTVFSAAAEQLKKIEKKPRSFAAFADLFRDFDPTVVFFDSFDLLGELAREVFTIFKSAVDGDLLPNFTFVFATRSSPSMFTSDPLNIYTIGFNSYNNEELEAVALACHTDKSDKEYEQYIHNIISICSPITRDVRDMIYISHVMRKAKISVDDEKFSVCVVDQLRSMRKQEQCRTNDISRAAKIILAASYIALKTTPTSDLLRLTRASKRSRKHPNFLENHEFVPLERVFAIAKALSYHHCNDFEIDFAGMIQVRTLLEMNLLEIRGDIRGDPKVKCLATEQEVLNVARDLGFEVGIYLESE